MFVIALTGGIGSGKTTVSEIFKSKNIPVIDTDIIARQIVEKDKPAYTEIIKLFGEKIVDKDKNIDRQSLRELIFSSKQKRIHLESILHPLIWNEVVSQLELIKSSSPMSPYCIVVVPLLLENTAKTKTIIFDRILVIDVKEETQIERTKKRDNSDDLIIKNIIKNQVSRQARNDAADDIILNTGDLNSLNKKVDDLHQQYIDLANNISN